MGNVNKPTPDRPGDLVRRDPGGSPAIRGQVFDVAVADAPNLRDYWRVILKRRWMVLATLLIVFSTVLIGTLKQQPLYRGTVLMEIAPEAPNVFNFQEIFQISNSNTDSYRETRFRMFESRSLGERVVRRLDLYRRPDFYKATALFGLIERNPDIIPSSERDQDLEVLKQALDNSIDNFLEHVSLVPIVGSDLVRISFDSYEPQMAARIANQLASEFIDQNLQLKWDETRKTSEWLSGQLVGLKAKLEKSEDSLLSYARYNEIIFITESQELAQVRLGKLEEEFLQAQGDRYRKEAMHSLIQGKENGTRDLPGALSDKLVTDMTTRLTELRENQAGLTSYLKSDYPSVVKDQKKIDVLEDALGRQREKIAQNVVDEFQVALNRETLLQEARENQKDLVNNIAEKSIQYNILKREVDTNRELYDGLLQRLKEAQVSAGLTVTNMHVVDSAQVPKGSIKPRIVLNLALGLFLGTGLGVGLAFFREYLDDTIKTEEDVEQYLHLPTVGVIPAIQLNGSERQNGKSSLPGGPQASTSLILKDQGKGEYNQHSIYEAFSSLRASVLLSGSPAPKTLLVTSALPQEGKTTTTVNLAAAFARLGTKKTMVVDCDMRRPSIHKATGVKKEPGLAQYLTGQLDLNEVIKVVPDIPNMHVITCGPIPPNPAELLISSALGELLTRLSSEYEFVLMDSPPIVGVSDARILASQVDGVILVTLANKTPREAVRDAQALLASASGRVLGVSLNQVDLAQGGYGYYGYYRYDYD